jgi:hypothetical protein
VSRTRTEEHWTTQNALFAMQQQEELEQYEEEMIREKQHRQRVRQEERYDRHIYIYTCYVVSKDMIYPIEINTLQCLHHVRGGMIW